MFSVGERWVLRRAKRISDPIARLRYLREVSAGARDRGSYPPRVAFVGMLLLAILAPVRGSRPQSRETSASRPDLRQTQQASSRVWLVEASPDHELYSNGLRVDTRFAVPHVPRSYTLFRDERPTSGTSPAGIVFHSTESDSIGFSIEHNKTLRQIGEAVLGYVRKERSYHYLIDKFGRVYRVVNESDAANHAGNAVWAWENAVCLNLNHAFLGVAFESRSVERASPAQIHSARVLTEMLISKYDIRPANCVAHGQVSVNPVNMRIGWHTDWARNFPWAELGLPNNYEQRLPALTEFGFRADEAYLDAAGESLWIGIHRSETGLRERAAQAGLTVRELRRRLERRYRHLEGKAGLYAD